MADQMTTEQMEQPAKQWQMVAVEKELKEINIKLDRFINTAEGYASRAELELVKKEMREYVEDKVKEAKGIIDAKYDPIYKLFWAIITAVILELIGIVFLVLNRG